MMCQQEPIKPTLLVQWHHIDSLTPAAVGILVHGNWTRATDQVSLLPTGADQRPWKAWGRRWHWSHFLRESIFILSFCMNIKGQGFFFFFLFFDQLISKHSVKGTRSTSVSYFQWYFGDVWQKIREKENPQLFKGLFSMGLGLQH